MVEFMLQNENQRKLLSNRLDRLEREEQSKQVIENQVKARGKNSKKNKVKSKNSNKPNSNNSASSVSELINGRTLTKTEEIIRILRADPALADYSNQIDKIKNVKPMPLYKKYIYFYLSSHPILMPFFLKSKHYHNFTLIILIFTQIVYYLGFVMWAILGKKKLKFFSPIRGQERKLFLDIELYSKTIFTNCIQNDDFMLQEVTKV